MRSPKLRGGGGAPARITSSNDWGRRELREELLRREARDPRPPSPPLIEREAISRKGGLKFGAGQS